MIASFAPLEPRFATKFSFLILLRQKNYIASDYLNFTVLAEQSQPSNKAIFVNFAELYILEMLVDTGRFYRGMAHHFGDISDVHSL